MRRARSCIESIIDKLLKGGYRFLDTARAHQAPDPDLLEWLEQYERQGIYLPVSLQAWLANVGNVDLRGTHPAWPRPGYVFEGMVPTNEVLYTDPLVVQVSSDYIAYSRKEWESSVREDGLESAGPFSIAIAPDYIHKANLSGGPPYEIRSDSAAVDSLLFNERHCTSFTNYLRVALRWGGFPGFEYINHVKRDLNEFSSSMLI
jgi:hypothetical protein